MDKHPSTAQDFFLNLSVAATLYASVASFLSLVFAILNRVFPQPNEYLGDPYSTGVRFAMATLIVVFPLFVWLSRMITKALAADPARRGSAVRRWFVFITLFLASVALASDLISLLYTFFNGDLTVRFALKVVAVLAVAGVVFWHYLGQIRETATEKKSLIAIYASAALVLASVVAAFAVFGSPSSVRDLRADSTRVSDLQALQWQTVNYWQLKGELPASIADLQNPISGFSVPVDPVTRAPYEYQATSDLSFNLCATFAMKGDEGYRDYGYAMPVDTINNNWAHGAGKVCFNRTIDPELYPPYDATMKARMEKAAASTVRF